MSKLRPTYAFMKTLEFLSGGRLYLKKSVKAITLSYNTWGRGSSGLRSSLVGVCSIQSYGMTPNFMHALIHRPLVPSSTLSLPASKCCSYQIFLCHLYLVMITQEVYFAEAAPHPVQEPRCTGPDIQEQHSLSICQDLLW